MRLRRRDHRGMGSERFRRAGLTVIALVAVAFAACGDDDDSDVDDGAATATAATTTATASPSPAVTTSPSPADTASAEPGTPFAGAREPVDGGSQPATTALLVDVRAAEHEGFDRVVFEFDGAAVPEYRVEYVEPPILQDASGMEVEVGGDAFLRVVFQGAAAHDDTGQATFGQQELMPGLRSVIEVQQTGDFEAVVSWVLGLAAEADFRVTELESPSRLVVDIGHS